jgi:hypothetical protein
MRQPAQEAAGILSAGGAVMGRRVKVIDVGSGLGGPARYLSKVFDCRVTGAA